MWQPRSYGVPLDKDYATASPLTKKTRLGKLGCKYAWYLLTVEHNVPLLNYFGAYCACEGVTEC